MTMIKIGKLSLLFISFFSLQGMEDSHKKLSKLSVEYGFSTRSNGKKFMVDESKKHVLPRQEDEVFAETNEKCKFFGGVYDGHGNSALYDGIKNHIYKNSMGKEYVGNYVSRYLKDNFLNFFYILNGSFEDRFNNAYANLEKEFTNFDDERVSQGSTATTAFIDDKNILHVAWVGDSTLKIVKKDGTLVAITKDHRPNVNEDEVDRVKEAGGKIQNGRLAGLESTRSLGDQSTKKSDDAKGLICTPEYKQIQLTDEDDFIVIATDGVWDYLDNDSVCGAIIRGVEAEQKNLSEIYEDPSLDDGGEESKSLEKSKLNLVARMMCDWARLRKSDDNISALVVKLHWNKDSDQNSKPNDLGDKNESRDKKEVLNSKKDDDKKGIWDLLSSFVTKRPWVVSGCVLLLAFAGIASYLKYVR